MTALRSHMPGVQAVGFRNIRMMISEACLTRRGGVET